MKYLASALKEFSAILGNYPFLNISFLGNEIGEYIVFSIFFVLLFIVLRVFRMVVLRRLKKVVKKISQEAGEVWVSIIDTIKPPFYWFLAFYVSLSVLNVNFLFWKIITGILIAWIAYQAVKAAHILVDYALNIYLKKQEDQGTRYAISMIGKLLKGLLWVFAVLVVFSNIGVDVTSIIAGLGIGGIAVALAVQNILNDLFSSFAIYFDRPFVVGDFIVVGEHMGVVEKIGIKTTRLRALQGEEIVISNRELTSVRVQNFRKMEKRRVVFHLGVVYETPLEKLKKIPFLLKEIIEKEELAEFDRAHFIKFNDFSLDFEIVYYILSADYNDYMDTHQNILFKIKEVFEKEKIDMAFPTQTLYIQNSNPAPE